MGKTLLVWEEVPENTRMFLIPDEVAQKHRDFLDEAHNCLINQDEMNDGLRFLNTALSNETPEKGFEEYQGIFKEYEVKLGSPLRDQNITAVYFSGFVL